MLKMFNEELPKEIERIEGSCWRCGDKAEGLYKKRKYCRVCCNFKIEMDK